MPVSLLIIFTPAPSTACYQTHYCREAVRSVHIICSPIKPPCVFEWYNKYSSYTKCYQGFRKVSWCACSKQDKPSKICEKVLDNRFHSRQYKDMQKIQAKWGTIGWQKSWNDTSTSKSLFQLGNKNGHVRTFSTTWTKLLYMHPHYRTKQWFTYSTTQITTKTILWMVTSQGAYWRKIHIGHYLFYW